jgi:hypothetical protein
MAIDAINSEINRLRGDIKRGFATEAFDASKWIQQVEMEERERRERNVGRR